MFVHFHPSPKPFILLTKIDGYSVGEHVTSNMKQRQIRKSWRKSVTLKLLKVFLTYCYRAACGFVVPWLSYRCTLPKSSRSVVLWAHCSCKSRAAWLQVEWDILHSTGIGAVCSHSEIRPHLTLCHCIPDGRTWWLSFIHPFMHPFEYITIVIVITTITGKALELNLGLRCLGIKVRLAYGRLQGFLVDLIRWVEFMGLFYLSLW